jgi:hypothetical protein
MRAIPTANAVCGWIVRSLLIAALSMGLFAHAGEVEDLYEAQVPVRGQSEAERATALTAAFESVLVKVTGRRDAVAAPGMREALRQPMTYVQQYLYRPLPADQASAVTDPDPQRYTQVMRVRFDAQAVNGLVQRAGVPLWGRVRPTTLLWVAVEEGATRYLLAADGAEELRPLLETEARRRGLPVLLPLLDLEDRRALSFTDVWGNFRDTVLQASGRYQVAAVAVGRLLREADGRWSARWSLYHEDAAEHWSVPAGNAAGDPARVLAGGADGIADLLGARYAQRSAADGDHFADLAVTGIAGLADYERAMRYLRQLDQVRELQVLMVESDNVLFRVRLGGDAGGLARTIAFGTTLRAVAGAPPLSYRLLP